MTGRSLLTLALTMLYCGAAHAQLSASGAQLVSVPLNGATFQGQSDSAAMPPNEDFVVFASTSDQLVENDLNLASDVFLSRDGSISLINKSLTGGFTSTGASQPAASQVLQNGTFGVVFVSQAGPQLVDGYQGTGAQVFLRVIGPKLDKTVLISRAFNSATGLAEPATGANNASLEPKVALIPGRPNRFSVAFVSKASNLFKGQALPGPAGAFLTPALATVVVSDDGVSVEEIRGPTLPFNSDAFDLFISGNGRAVAFATSATNATNPPINCGGATCPSHVYIFEPFKSSEGAKLLSYVPDSSGTGQPANGFSKRPSLSFDATVAAFVTNAPDFGSTGRNIVVARERGQAIPTVLSKSFNADPSLDQLSNGEVSDAYISPNGFYVAFSDDSSNLTADAAANPRQRFQVYLKNRGNREISMLSKNAAGEPGTASSSQVALGGRGFGSLEVFAAFRSSATNFDGSVQSATQTRIFRNDLKLAPPRLTANVPISVPPDVQVKNKKVTIKLQRFRAPAQARGVEPFASSVTYRVTTRSAGTNYRTITTTTRNQVTIANLSPGRYTVSYRVVSTSGTTRTRSQTSSSTTFTIR